ncbi:MAG: DUF255 domain-containing protein [Pseudomonadota bacterium]
MLIPLLLACIFTAHAGPPRNALTGATSPYLAMHAGDPVAWQPWSKETLTRARREDRLIFVSSGFFACHWCHVLQQESFSDPGFAALLNQHFMPIKVDREADPALGAELRRAMQAISGRAGWPLNLVLSPQGDPLYGFIYAPRPELIARLARIHRLRQDAPQRIEGLAHAASAELQPQPSPTACLEADAARDLLRDALLQAADPLAGGFGEGAKFPHAIRLLAMLRILEQAPDPALREHLNLTLDTMANSGLRDRVGGAFFRYTTDPAWQHPHFEQMLIDQALLARVYLRAAKILPAPRFRSTAERLIHAILHDFAHPSGLYVSSISALDADGVEGGGYLWTETALRALLSDAAWRATRHWGWAHHDDWHGGQLPSRIDTSPESRDALQRMLKARPRPVHPRDKLTPIAANGQLLATLSEACIDGVHEACPAGQRLAARLGVLTHGDIDDLRDLTHLADGLAGWGRRHNDQVAVEQARAALESAARQFQRADGWQTSRRPLPPWSGATPDLPDDEYPSASATWWRLASRMGLSNSIPPCPSSSVREEPLAYISTLLEAVEAARPMNPRDAQGSNVLSR